MHDGDEHTRAAFREDPDWGPAVDRLAWYRSDHGDAAGALELLFRFGDSWETDQLEEFVTDAQAPALGRNDRCWCGSGRKYKVCHLGRPALAPLPDRVRWIQRKAEMYVERRGGALAAEKHVRAGRVGWDPDEPFVVDTLLVEDGWFGTFLDERGTLLPDDELLLARSWMLVERSVHEIVEIVGPLVRVRDLRTGDRREVLGGFLTSMSYPGQMVCGRAVPDSERHQFVGELRVVPPGTEQRMLEILDEGDGLALVQHVAARIRPPRLAVAGTGEQPTDCRAVLDVADTATARAVLDDRYERRGDEWLSLARLDDGSDRVLGTLGLRGAQLTVETMAPSRLDTFLAELRDALPDARPVSDERRPVRAADAAAAPAGARLPAEAVEELQDRFERRWCDEQVPALGGRTPREAAADPTRRDEVIRLIRSFPATDVMPGGFGMRPARLLALLGLDD